MRFLWTCLLLTTIPIGPATKASFSVDGKASASTIAVASVQPRAGAPGYSWLRIYFYPAALGGADATAAAQGHTDSISAPWSAVLQLTVDKTSHVWQVDLSLPGHTCTIVDSDRGVKDAVQEFRFDGAHLQLKANGSHVCDLSSLHMPNPTFTWDVTLDVPVVTNTGRAPYSEPSPRITSTYRAPSS